MPSWYQKPPLGTLLNLRHPLIRNPFASIAFNENMDRPHACCYGLPGTTTGWKRAGYNGTAGSDWTADEAGIAWKSISGSYLAWGAIPVDASNYAPLTMAILFNPSQNGGFQTSGRAVELSSGDSGITLCYQGGSVGSPWRGLKGAVSWLGITGTNNPTTGPAAAALVMKADWTFKIYSIDYLTGLTTVGGNGNTTKPVNGDGNVALHGNTANAGWGPSIYSLALWLNTEWAQDEFFEWAENPWSVFDPDITTTKAVVYFFSSGVTYSDTVAVGVKSGVAVSPVLTSRPTVSAGVKSGGTSSSLVAYARPTVGSGIKFGASSVVLSPAGVVAVGIKFGGSSSSLKTTARPTVAAGVKIGGTSVLFVSGGTTLRGAIRSKLYADLSSLVGQRVWIDHPPQSYVTSSGAAVTFSVLSDQPGVNLDGFDGTSEASVSVAIWAEAKSDALSAAKLLRSQWLTFSGLVGSISFDFVLIDGRPSTYRIPVDSSDWGGWIVETNLTIGWR